MPYPWVIEDIEQVHAEMKDLYEHTLSILEQRLNCLHGVSRTRSYWHCLVGPWLFYYVNLMWHHYTTLTKALERLGSVETHGLAEASFITPANTLQFLHESTDDPYNHQLYTRLCRALGIPIREYRELDEAERIGARNNPEGLPAKPKSRILGRLKARGVRALHKWSQKIVGVHAQTVLQRSFLPASLEWALAATSWARIWPHEGGLYTPNPNIAPDSAMRTLIRGTEIEPKANELKHLIGSFMAEDIPRVFVEEYADLVAFSDHNYPYRSPRTVLSTASWDNDEAFGHFAGRCAEAGARLVGGETSAIYGIEEDSQILDFERSLVDRYLTWGWSDPDDPRCIPTPAGRLISIRERTQTSLGTDILYTGTVALRFPVLARPDFSGYFDLQQRFFRAVDADLRRRIRVRLHASDFGWGIERRLVEAIPDLNIERWETTFEESLQASRLYVCDHMSTTWTMALASNTPTIIFWDPTYTPVRDAMQPVFDIARAAGIVHDTPESAAHWVAKVYSDVETWWFDEKTQRALRDFRHYVGRTSATPLRDWRAVLGRLISN